MSIPAAESCARADLNVTCYDRYNGAHSIGIRRDGVRVPTIGVQHEPRERVAERAPFAGHQAAVRCAAA